MSANDVIRKNLFKGLLLFLGLANVGLLVVGYFQPDGLEHIYFFDVGQGDAALIKTRQNHYILIDGGPDNSVISQLDSVIPIWHRQLDLVILTHPHADHATGLLSVMDRYRVDKFWYTGASYDSETYKTLISNLTTKHIPIQLANQGDSYAIDSTNVKILFPVEEKPVAKDSNETSIVSLVRYQSLNILFTGDASSNNEKTYAAQAPDVDIVKVPHHGSQSASSSLLINQIRPEVGIISVGANNNFGHPNVDTIARYESSGTKLYRTDAGMVEIISDGTSYQVQQR